MSQAKQNLLGRVFGRKGVWRRKKRGSRPANAKRSMQFERLEDRQLLSTVTTEFPESGGSAPIGPLPIRGLIAQQIAPVNISQGTAVTVVPLQGDFQATGGSSPAIRIQIVADSNSSLFAAPPLVLPSGLLVLRTTADASGTANLSVRGADESGQSAVATQVVTVSTASADQSVATAIAPLTAATFGLATPDSSSGMGSDDSNLVGTITTFAGGGQASPPESVAVDTSGNLFIAYPAANVVREVDLSTGLNSVVAGTGVAGYQGDHGLATNAELNYPMGVAVDAAGDVFIADSGNNVVREVNLSTGNITTVAGDGSIGYGGFSDSGPATATQLNWPTAVALDSHGNLFIADTGNSLIREVPAVNGANPSITTVAGYEYPESGGYGSLAGYSGDGGSPWGAELNEPMGLAVDAAGNLFIADSGNNVIRKVDFSAGVITTVAGDGNAGWWGYGGYGGYSGYSGDGGPATDAQLNDPQGVALDAAGNLFIADTGNHAIQKVNHSTQTINNVAGDGSFGYGGFSGDGGQATAAQLGFPTGVALDDASGNMYVADVGEDIVLAVSSAGAVSTLTNGIGDQGPATSAQLSTPEGVASDSSGDLFIADTSDNDIREVNAVTGVITTVAGIGGDGYGGLAGYSGDGGPATRAQLDAPTGVAVDAAGDLFIADSGNNVIREVNHATGEITTIVGDAVDGNAGYSGDGGPATQAELDYPTAIAVDAAGDQLFIADSGNNAVRQVDFSTGRISTIVGLGVPNGHGGFSGGDGVELSDPQGLALDAADNLFIADTDNDVIRQLDLATGTVTTFAGTVGEPGNNGDAGPAAGALLSYPTGIVVDGFGDLFIADTGNNVVRNVVDGQINTVAGDDSAGYTGDGGQAIAAQLNWPNGLAADSAGHLFIADTGNNVVREVFNKSIPAVSLISSAAGASTYGRVITFTAIAAATDLDGDKPTGSISFYDGANYLGSVALDGSGDATLTTSTLNVRDHSITAVYDPEGDPNYMGGADAVLTQEVDPTAQITAVPIGNVSPVGSAITVGAAVGGLPAGQTATYVWNVTNPAGQNVGTGSSIDFRFTPTTAGTYTVTLVASAADCASAPASEAIRAIAVTAWSSGSIATAVGNGASGNSGDSGGPTLAQLTGPAGAAVDDAGDIFIADAAANVVREVNHSTGLITTVAGDGSAGSGGDGGAATSAELNGPTSVAVDAAGDQLFIADTGNNVIREVNLSTGTIITVAGDGVSGYAGNGGQATEAKLNGPSGVAVDNNGDLFIADSGNNVLREVNLSTGVIITVAGDAVQGYAGDGGQAASAELYEPQGLAVDAFGDLFIADTGNEIVREVDPSGTISTVAGMHGVTGYGGNGGAAASASLNDPQGIAVDALGDLFIADTGNQVIREVAPSGVISTVAGSPDDPGYSGDGGPATSATLNAPEGIALDPSRNLFIADTGNHVIREVSNNTDMKVSTSTPGGSSTYGQNVVVTATLPAGATGNVTFADGTTFLTKTLGTGDSNLSDALEFDGNGGYVDIPASNSLQVESAPFSIAAWIYPTASNLNAIFANSADDEQGAVLYVDTQQNLITLSKAGEQIDQSVPFTFSVDTWYHVVAVQNFSGGAPSDVQFYVNGTLVGTTAGDTTPYLPSYGHDASIGWVAGDAESNFQGSVDELLVFNRALTQSDVSTLCGGANGYFGSTVSGPCASGLVAGYHFDEGAGNTVQDFSGNGNAGTIEGNLAWGAGKVVSPQTFSFNDSSLSVGGHALVLTYAGDGANPPCTIISDEKVEQAPTTTVATSQVSGQSLSLTATVSGPNPNDVPTGTVDFHYCKVDLGTVGLDSNGVATIPAGSPFIVSGDITAIYSGDARFLGSQSTPFTQQITPPAELPTSTVLAISPTAAAVGYPIQVTATVTTPAPGDTIPTGMVRFDFSNASSTLTFSFLAPLDSNGVASVALPWQTVPDSYDVTATYEGDAISAPSSDEESAQISGYGGYSGGSGGGTPNAVGLYPSGNTPSSQISQVITSTTNIGASPTTAPYGTPITLTARVTFGSYKIHTGDVPSTASPDFVIFKPAAYIEFFDNVGTIPVFLGEFGLTAAQVESQTPMVRSFAVSTLDVGTHEIYAVFTGFYGKGLIEISSSESGKVAVTVVGSSPTTTTISASPATIGPGGRSTLTATVSEAGSAGTPAGTVAFYQQSSPPGSGDTPIGTATLSSGTATFSVAPSAVGTYTYWAEYEGSTTPYFTASTSFSPADVSVITSSGESVTISAPDDAAFTPASIASAGDPGEFLLTRSGPNLNQSLTVAYTTSGTAVEGQDYTLSGAATFPAGRTETWIQVNPSWHALGAEGARNVTLILTSTGTYAIGSSSSATVTIEDSSIDNLAPSPLTDGSLDLPFDPLGIHYLSGSLAENKVISTDVQLSPPPTGYSLTQVTAMLSVDGLPTNLTQTFNPSPGTVNWSSLYRFAFDVNAGALPTGRYNWSMTVTESFNGGLSGQPVTYYGQVDVLNWSHSLFGSGWQLESLDQLVPNVNVNGVSLVRGDGAMGFFWSIGGGNFRSEPGPFDSYQLSLSGGVYTLTGADGIQETFDSWGRLATVTDNDGNVTTYRYHTPDGALLEITDPEKRVTKYDPLAGSTSLVGAVTDPSGRVTTLAYSGEQLTTITQPIPAVSGETQAPVTTFTYFVNSGLLATESDANSNLTNFAYYPDLTLNKATATGQPSLVYQSVASASLPQAGGYLLPVSSIFATSQDQSGNTTTYTLDRFGDPTSVTDALHNTTTYHLDDNGRVTEMDQPNPGTGVPVTTYTYDSEGDLLTEHDPNGTTQNWSYELCSTPGGNFWQLASYTDGLSNTTYYGLDADGNVLSVTQSPSNAAYAITRYTYTTVSSGAGIPGGQVATMTDADNNETTYSYAYSSSGMVETTTYAAGTSVAGTVTDDYNLAGDLLWETDELGASPDDPAHTTTYTYDALDRPVSVVGPPDASGQHPETDYLYDPMGDLVQQTQVVGRSPLVTEVSTYKYNSLEELALETDPGPNGGAPVTTSFTYTPTGQLHTETDPRRNTTTYTYTALGQLQTVITPSLNIANASPTSPLFVTKYTYDALGRLSTETDPARQTSSGLVSPVTSYSYAYSNHDLVVTTSLPRPGTGTLDSYDADGNLVYSEDAAALAVNYTYDGMNRPEQVSVNGQLVGPVYDGVGNVLSDTDMEGNVTNYDYNARNELTETIQPSPDGTAPQPKTYYGYDPAGKLTSEKDPLGNITGYTYDSLGRLISTTAPNPVGGLAAGSPLTTGYSYDLVGNLLTETDPLQNVTTYGYDLANNLTSMRLPNPTTGSATGGPLTTYSYDGDGNLLSLDDPNLNTTTWTYNPANLVSSQTNQLGAVATSNYDPAGDLTQYVDADGRETDYNYDLAGDVSQEIWKSSAGVKGAISNEINYVYDGDGRLTVAWDNSSSYDASLDLLGRPQTIALDFAGMQTQGVALNQTFNYDNQISSLAVAVGTITDTVVSPPRGPVPILPGDPMFSPEASGLTKAPSFTAASGGSYYKDSTGTVHMFTYGASLDLENAYTYNADDQLASITQGMAPSQSVYGTNYVAPKTAAFGYDGDGRLLTMDLYDAGTIGVTSNLGTPAVHAAYGYDDASRLTNLTYTGPGAGTLASYGLTYDDDSRVTNVTSSADTGTIYSSTSYSYDHDNQLTGTQYNDSSQVSQTFDSNGNRMSQTALAATVNDSVGSDNRLLFDGTYHYAYDADGNRTAKYIGGAPVNNQVPRGATDVTTYTWDNRNRLTSVKHQATVGGAVDSAVYYNYDMFNRMISRSATNTPEQFFVYDGQNLLLVLNSKGVVQDRYFNGPAVDQVLASETPTGGVEWLLADYEGSIRDVATYSDSSHTTSKFDHMVYDAFGNLVSQTNSGNQPRFTYTGQEWDSAAGLYYDSARWYDPASGSFISQDPLSFGGGDTNLSRYCGNSPTNYIDPSGMDGVEKTYGEMTTQQYEAATEGMGPGQLAAFHAKNVFNDLFGFPEQRLVVPGGRHGAVGRVGGGGGASGGGIPVRNNANNANAEPGALTNLFNNLVNDTLGPGQAGDSFDQFSNFVYGFDDALTNGGTQWIRQNVTGDYANYHSAAYGLGGVLGTGTSIVTGFANPCGDMGMALKALNVFQALGNGSNLLNDVENGNWCGAAGNALGLLGNASQLSRSCFAAGTPLLTPEGSKPIEQFQVGDLLLSAPENDPAGPIQARRVEEVFQRVSPLIELRVGGRTIRTTVEHPFFVEGKGWTKAGALSPGALLRSHDGQSVSLDSILPTEVVAEVYNLRIAEYHTYFVGAADWGFSVWAHNTEYLTAPDPRKGYDPGAMQVEHPIAQVFGGTATREAEAAMNYRKGGLEGALRKYENYLTQGGMKPAAARAVIQSEIESMARDVNATPFGNLPGGFSLGDLDQ